MSSTKLRKQPIAEQIAYYEDQISKIDAAIARAIAQKKVYRKKLTILQKPNAEENHQKRLSQYEKAKSEKKKREMELAWKHFEMQRQVEECKRMNGKL